MPLCALWLTAAGVGAEDCEGDDGGADDGHPVDGVPAQRAAGEAGVGFAVEAGGAGQRAFVGAAAPAGVELGAELFAAGEADALADLAAGGGFLDELAGARFVVF